MISGAIRLDGRPGHSGAASRPIYLSPPISASALYRAHVIAIDVGFIIACHTRPPRDAAVDRPILAVEAGADRMRFGDKYGGRRRCYRMLRGERR